jgi:hypothetical protein
MSGPLAQPAAHRVTLGTLRHVGRGLVVLVDVWPSERWWVWPVSCLSETVGRAITTARAAGYKLEVVWVSVRLDEAHPYRLRTVTVTGRLGHA